MYRDIVTMCWSITQVNRNLSDRKNLSNYSVKYLKKARGDLASMLEELEKVNPGDTIKIKDREGRSRSFSLLEVATMLGDVKKVMELNLIDNVQEWARSKA